ncbi:MATE family efflux transporter [Salinarimonas ramus]|uniref:MATE family efflux transporter n=1 Tax=Salinarimonas ramus TaxID=690164 RepID=A0A917QBH0_9HYPH|nr:MATE family efflux transporter [Salinarimonas ramus]GGK41204.1 MATE family efflux transporter [Salinarimonas ramus]
MTSIQAGKTASQEEGRFVSGSTLRHVLVMTTTGAVGLVAIFLVDLLSLLYISRLGVKAITAGVGLATILLFFVTSINVGLMIATTALTSRALGARDRAGARRLAASTLTWTVLAATVATAIVWPLAPWVMGLLGATGEAHRVATEFVRIVLPANILMAVGMGASGVLRAVGDARRAMYVTLSGALVIAVLDPILIFGLDLGWHGAAIGTIVSRAIFLVVGLHGVWRVHGLLARPSRTDLATHAAPMAYIAGPAVLTAVASPVAAGFAAAVIARFGDEAIAGNAIVERLVPLAFGGLFALSGAVGPILGQNWGALRYDRMRTILRDSMLVAALYVVVTWAALVLLRHEIVALFGITGAAADLVRFFCLIAGPVWFFNGLLFVANASFNNLGYPLYSTAFNWGRATLGTLPFAYAGAALAGPEGVLAGVGLGSVGFGCVAIATAFWTVRALETREGAVETARPVDVLERA